MLIDGTLEKEDLRDGRLVDHHGVKCVLNKTVYKLHHTYTLYGGDEYMLLLPNKKGDFNGEGSFYIWFERG